MAPLLDCSMLAAGLSLGLVVGLSLAGLTSTLVAALHVGAERLLAGFDVLSGTHTLELRRSRRILNDSNKICVRGGPISNEKLQKINSLGISRKLLRSHD